MLVECPNPACARKVRVGLAFGSEARENIEGLSLLASNCARSRSNGATCAAAERVLRLQAERAAQKENRWEEDEAAA